MPQRSIDGYHSGAKAMTTNQTIDGMTPEQAQAVSDGVDGILFGKPTCERADFEEWCASEDMDPKSQSGFLMWESWKARSQKPSAQPQGDPIGYAAWNTGINPGTRLMRYDGMVLVSPTRSEIYCVPIYAELPAPVAVMPERLQQVLKFLDGSENLDGNWFGEPGPTGSLLWWRNELRKALAEINLFAKQQ